MSGSAPPAVLVLFVGFLVVMPLVALVSARLRLPYTVALVLVGLAISALPIHEGVELSPALAVTVLLPGLVFEAAYRLDGDELRRTFGGVALLAVPGVIVTAAVVAIILNVATGLPLNEAFLVGAIVSATDPVAVVSTMSRLSAPTRLVTLVDAESLFNDGTAALVFAVAVAALASQPPTLADNTLQFAVGLLSSVVIGAMSGFLISRVLKTTSDHLIELTLTLLAAYGTYLVADLVHQSGIIASVVAGIFVGTYGRREGISPRAQEAIDVVWEFLAYVLSGAAFLLVGLAIPLGTLAAAAISIAWGVAAVLIGRAVVVYGVLGGAAQLSRRIGDAASLPLSWLHVMNWTGLRGAVATALALSIPDGTADRELLQGIAFGIVLFTLVVQGTTAGRVLRWAGVAGDASLPRSLATRAP
ncbi:MAG: cation:proton antiporter [Candidatus Limnocylindrales bacterium]